jgi:ABC-2 type transport system ATP-binding protein
MVRPSSGSLHVFGLDPADERQGLEVRRRAAFVSEATRFDPGMSVGGILALTASFFPGWRADLAASYLARFDLDSGRQLQGLAPEARARLLLVLAVARDPELLILDDPVAGLDAAAAQELLRMIVAYVAEGGASVVFGSRNVAEAEQIADQVVILREGRARLAVGLDELQAHYRRVVLQFREKAPRAALESAQVMRARADDRTLDLVVAGDEAPVLEQASRLGARTVEVAPMTLREIFLECLGAED